MTIKDTIKEKINQVLKQKYGLNELEFQIEYPPQSELGDYSSNVAMVLAQKLGKNPLNVGEEIRQELTAKEFAKIELVQPGFINFYLAEELLTNQVDEILKAKEKFGQNKADKSQKIQVEFISANPTGPLTLANGRGGFSGDVLARVLKLAGHQVEREYFVNDFGNQIKILGHSILKDSVAQYTGDYIDELTRELELETKFKSTTKNDPETVGRWAAQKILEEEIKPAVVQAGIKFDNWFSEYELHQSGAVDQILKVLDEKNLVFQKEGAQWLKTAEAETSDDDKDRVLVKSNGDKTYFLADIAYHWNKFHERGFDKVINLWGADHHGYVPRMKLTTTLLGYPGQLEILLMQLVRLIKNGQEFRMSKRQGVYVELTELIHEVGLDVTRFFFLMHANNKPMDFDLDLAKERSAKNPVFYVQYAHARICSILDKAENLAKINTEKKLETSERKLIKELLKWPELVAEVARSYEVHKIAFYAIGLADKFHKFYENCRVIENNQMQEKRLKIIQATQQVLQNVLQTLGVAAPQKM